MAESVDAAKAEVNRRKVALARAKNEVRFQSAELKDAKLELKATRINVRASRNGRNKAYRRTHRGFFESQEHFTNRTKAERQEEAYVKEHRV